MKQRNEKLNTTNNLNAINQHKGTKDMKNQNFEEIKKIINKGKTIYWCESVMYGKQLVSIGNISLKEKTFLIVKEYKKGQSVFICSFHTHGYGFFMESKDLAESLQIYKSTQGRDYFYTVNELTDKRNHKTKAIEEVLNKKELDDYLMEYFEGIKSYFISGYDDSIVQGLFEFIKSA